MPRELYNEGRVTGLSAYESYIKNALEEDPDAELASEREWLAATLAMGSSMLLRVSADVGLVRDFQLPEESKLVAPSTIQASLFVADPDDFDESIFDYTGWVKQVASYGDLILNDDTHPEDEAITYDYGEDSMDDAEKARMMNYLRIQDGLVLQPGSWETRVEEEFILDKDENVILQNDTTGIAATVDLAHNKPKRILKYPNFTEPPTVRLRFSREVTEPFLVLFTGFVDWKVLIGECGLDGGAADTAHPYNGDFLGPELFPWANKIMFHTSTATSYQMQTSLSAGSGNVHIITDPDSFETKIVVDNDISSNSPYLTVVQTNDGGQTVLDLDTSALLNDNLHEGVGIKLTEVTNGITIATNLAAGTGIKITDNMPTTTKQTIATNIRGGTGISVSTSSGALVIDNEAASKAFTYLSSGDTKYGSVGIRTASGGFEDGGSTSDHYGDAFWIQWGHYFYGYNSTTTSGNPLTTPSSRGVISVSFKPYTSTDENGDDIITGATFQFRSTSQATLSRYHTFSSESDEFRFSSDTDVSSICKIVFPRGSALRALSNFNNIAIDTSSLVNGYWRFYDNTNGTVSGLKYAGCNRLVRIAVDPYDWNGNEEFLAYNIYAMTLFDDNGGQLFENEYTSHSDLRAAGLGMYVTMDIVVRD